MNYLIEQQTAQYSFARGVLSVVGDGKFFNASRIAVDVACVFQFPAGDR